ncbi:MAG: hypothetical protein R3C01_06980 [Planctomycetaceae bacterium]
MRRCVFAFLIAACANVDVTATADDVTRKQTETLVRQLGSDSFRTRENAEDELLKLGLLSKAALFAGMNSQDNETALRCRRIWSVIRIDAGLQQGWEQLREIIGDAPESREFFDQMFQAAPEYWCGFVESPKEAQTLFEERRKELQEQLRKGKGGNWEAGLANLLHAGVRAKTEAPQEELPRVDELLCLGRSQLALESREPLRRLLKEWKSRTNADGPPFDRLLLALRERQPQAADIARELLRDSKTPAKQRQYALLTLTNTDNAEDDKLIDLALEDSSSLDMLFSNGILITSQLRDVALAVKIHRKGLNPADFGFNSLRPDDLTTYSLPSLGFSDSTARNEAFENWSAFNSQPQPQKSN